MTELPKPRPKKKLGEQYARKTVQQNVQAGQKTVIVVTVFLGLLAILFVSLYFYQAPIIENQIRYLEDMKGRSAWDAAEIERDQLILRIGKVVLAVMAIAHVILELAMSGLCFLAKSRPVAALIAALVLFSISILLHALMNPLAVLPISLLGVVLFLFRAIAIFVLIRGIRAARKYEQMKQAQA